MKYIRYSVTTRWNCWRVFHWAPEARSCVSITRTAEGFSIGRPKPEAASQPQELLKGFPLGARSPKLRLNHKLDGTIWWLLCILCFGQQCDTETNCMNPIRVETEVESTKLTFRYFRFPPHRRLGFRSSSFLLFVTQRLLVFVYRRFGAAYQSHLFGLFDPRSEDWPSVAKRLYTSHNSLRRAKVLPRMTQMFENVVKNEIHSKNSELGLCAN
jgi:hypothetical protein